MQCAKKSWPKKDSIHMFKVSVAKTRGFVTCVVRASGVVRALRPHGCVSALCDVVTYLWAGRVQRVPNIGMGNLALIRDC
jgi:hypothetical protein